MTFVTRLWMKLTQNKALEEYSGRMEKIFFESIYRAFYVTGLSHSNTSVGYFIYSSMIKILNFLLLCSEIGQFFHMTWTLDAIIDSINAIIIQMGSIYKYWNLITHRKIFKALAMAMESPNFDISTKARKDLLAVWVKRNRIYTNFLLILGTITLAAWYGFPLMDDIEYNFMVAVYFPFDYENPTTYPIVYFILLIVFSYISYGVMVNDIIMQTYLMQLLCQYTVLNDCLCNIGTECAENFKEMSVNELLYNEQFRREYRRRLRDLTNQHKFILDKTTEFRKILSGPMLGHLCGSTILICSIGYQIVMSISVNITKCLMSFFFLGYNMIILYILCRWCEEITKQSEGIGVAAYCSGWERGFATIPGVRSSILLILTRANKPLVLTAGGMYDLSLDNYANLVKTSYSALTMLLRFHNE
ncbi:unnamed protein product [Parnassius mnemosyne]|uniref:Odorant receptor n=1 Tax=Parnassius mnemosyne TaxID=213953 RepID=A0AAV1LUI0_9NEOP